MGHRRDQLFSFAVFVMLARLLDKPAIGHFAIAFVFMDIGRDFATAGVSRRVAHAKDLSSRDLDTIFWTNIFLAAAYSVLILGLRRSPARIRCTRLAAVLAWLTIPVILSGAGNTRAWRFGCASSGTRRLRSDPCSPG